jgi:hypothetical protein
MSSNNELIVGGIFCDLEKAFNCVNNNILLLKLETYEITGKDRELYHSYLKDRYQRVLIYNMTHHYRTLSNWALITHRVPQGYVLGPLLFLLYMTDLPQIINNISTPILFADNNIYSLQHHCI